MKRSLIIFIVLTLGMCAYGTLSRNTHSGATIGSATPTIQSGYVQINSVTADDTDLATTTSYWDSIDDTFIAISPWWNTVELTFYGYGDGVGDGSPDGATFTFMVYAARWYGGAKKVYEGVGTVGAQQMSVNPVTEASLNSGAADSDYCWVDTIDPNGNGDEWISDIQLSGNAGNDGIATASFDLNGYTGIYVYIKDMTAQSVTSITCIASGY